MAVPTLIAITPATGPSSGGDLVRLRGTGFAERVQVVFGGAVAAVLNVRAAGGESFADVRTPAHASGAIDVLLRNLAPDGAPVPGEEATLLAAYRFLRAPIIREADLTRVVRGLLRELKRQVIENVSASVALDYDDTPSDGLNVVAMAKLPSLVLSGPRLVEKGGQRRIVRSLVAIGTQGLQDDRQTLDGGRGRVQRLVGELERAPVVDRQQRLLRTVEGDEPRHHPECQHQR